MEKFNCPNCKCDFHNSHNNVFYTCPISVQCTDCRYIFQIFNGLEEIRKHPGVYGGRSAYDIRKLGIEVDKDIPDDAVVTVDENYEAVWSYMVKKKM